MTIQNESHQGVNRSFRLLTTSGETITKYQILYYGATADTVTAVTGAAGILGTFRAMESAASTVTGVSGHRIECELLCPGDIVYLLNGGTCTIGTPVEIEGNDGRVADMGAAASGDGQKKIGRALEGSTTDGDPVLVLIG